MPITTRHQLSTATSTSLSTTVTIRQHVTNTSGSSGMAHPEEEESGRIHDNHEEDDNLNLSDNTLNQST
jgi:hypothetical protein